MRNIIRNIFILSAILLSLQAHAQIEWLTAEYDFGTIKEASGPVTGSVSFVNRGNEPTFIARVRPSCGCTGATFTEGVIAPGDTATVTFTYDPKHRPGRFAKTIKVFTGEDNAQSLIKIVGTVIGTPETLFSGYPVEVGPMRLSEKLIDCGTVRYGTTRHVFLQACNQSELTIHPQIECDAKSLSIQAANDSIAPGDVLSISVYFNSRETKGPQELEIPILIRADKDSEDSETVTFRANIVPDVSNLTPEEIDNGPRIYLLPDLVDLERVSPKKTEIEVEFGISNEGNSDLKISRMYSKTPGVKPISYPTVLQPGKKGKAKVRLDVEQLPPGPHSVRLEIVSNDPINPIRVLRIALEKP